VASADAGLKFMAQMRGTAVADMTGKSRLALLVLAAVLATTAAEAQDWRSLAIHGDPLDEKPRYTTVREGQRETQVADDVLGYYLRRKERHFRDRWATKSRKGSQLIGSARRRSEGDGDEEVDRKERMAAKEKNPFTKSNSQKEKVLVRDGKLEEEEAEAAAEDPKRPRQRRKKAGKGHRRKGQKGKMRIPAALRAALEEARISIVEKWTESQNRRQAAAAQAGGLMRTLFTRNILPTFAPESVSVQIVAQWVNVLAITAAWMTLGGMYSAGGSGKSTSRSGSLAGHKEENPEFWQALLPDSQQVAHVFQTLAAAAETWHDEL